MVRKSARFFLIPLTGALAVIAGCMTGDPADKMIQMVDQSPPEKRPPDWDTTRSLMMRPSPSVGDVAPDFTLRTANDDQSITRTKYQLGKPQVLVFGSFT